MFDIVLSKGDSKHRLTMIKGSTPPYRHIMISEEGTPSSQYLDLDGAFDVLSELVKRGFKYDPNGMARWKVTPQGRVR